MNFINIDLLSFSLQKAMVCNLEFLGYLVVLLILLTIGVNVLKILSPLKNFSHAFLKDNFIASIGLGFFKILFGVLICFYAWTITQSIYSTIIEYINSENWYQSYIYTIGDVGKINISLQQQEGLLLIEKLFNNSSGFFIVLIIIVGLFFMVSSIDTIFLKISYLLGSICFLVITLSLTGGIYIEIIKTYMVSNPMQQNSPAFSVENSTSKATTSDPKAVSLPPQ